MLINIINCNVNLLSSWFRADVSNCQAIVFSSSSACMSVGAQRCNRFYFSKIDSDRLNWLKFINTIYGSFVRCVQYKRESKQKRKIKKIHERDHRGEWFAWIYIVFHSNDFSAFEFHNVIIKIYLYKKKECKILFALRCPVSSNDLYILMLGYSINLSNSLNDFIFSRIRT